MNANTFNPLRAAREELAGLNDILRTLTQRERADMEAMAAAEASLNATRKILGYVRITLDILRTRVQELEQQHER
jgi:hypothetical protein